MVENLCCRYLFIKIYFIKRIPASRHKPLWQLIYQKMISQGPASTQDPEPYRDDSWPRTLLIGLRFQEPMGTQCPIDRTQDPGLYENPGPKISKWPRTLTTGPRTQKPLKTEDARLCEASGTRALLGKTDVQETMMTQDPGSYRELCFSIVTTGLVTSYFEEHLKLVIS